jgi:hypothetical protein
MCERRAAFFVNKIQLLSQDAGYILNSDTDWRVLRASIAHNIEKTQSRGISWRLDSSPLACGRTKEAGNVIIQFGYVNTNISVRLRPACSRRPYGEKPCGRWADDCEKYVHQWFLFLKSRVCYSFFWMYESLYVYILYVFLIFSLVYVRLRELMWVDSCKYLHCECTDRVGGTVGLVLL